MQIVPADIRLLKRAVKHGRVRSPETQQLLDVIERLQPGKAKALVLRKGDEPERARSRISYAAKIAGKPLQIAIADGRVLFALREIKRRGRPRKNPR